jgi:predicted nucleotidyltransferase
MKKGGAKPSRDWEATFSSWGAAPGTTEQTKCDNAERAVRKAICASEKLSSKSIDVFTQGSYANRTNVRQDSDVDICVMYKDAFFPDYSMSEGLNDAALGYSDGTYPYAEFKNDVEDALVSYFGEDSVTRGNKAFDVHANTYRIDADVVPAFEHRRFHGTPQSNWFYSGTELHPDDGGSITNWPRQNYDNGVEKNEATGRRFKAVVRILKRLRNEMADEGYDAAEPIPSYLIECLVWNVPNDGLGHDTLTADVRHALAHLWNETRTDESCKEWGEVNELKYLFRPSQPWTRSAVNTFLQAAWDYIGFE